MASVTPAKMLLYREYWQRMIEQKRSRELCDLIAELTSERKPQLDSLIEDCIVDLARAVRDPAYLVNVSLTQLSHMATILAASPDRDSYTAVRNAIHMIMYQAH